MSGWGKLKATLEQKPYLITLSLAGILVLVSGLAVLGINFDQNTSVPIEIIEASSTPSPVGFKILVDVGGAVIKPGIYELGLASRVNDALVAAGGLAAAADRDWVSQNLNLAEKLADGRKIYVPFKGEAADLSESFPSQSQSLSELININAASLTELDSLWGIGPVTGQKIIDNRPYAKIEELLEKKIVKTNVYEAIKDKITVL
jgi:competence protein ComEA